MYEEVRKGMGNMLEGKGQTGKKSLGIYVHIPFCAKKCGYCDFLSQVGSRDLQRRYCERLLEEIDSVKEIARDYCVDTIFLGGGTPSVLKPEWIQRILESVFQRFSKNSELEITIECNPGTLDQEKIRCYRQSGINRLSLGLQSANGMELRELGRIHTWEQFLESAELVRRSFDDWNVDIMSALPGQSVQSYEDTLERVTALAPSHISAYSLIIEEGTPFYEKYQEDEKLRRQGKKPHFLPDEDTERQMYELTGQILECHGYKRYEISNYAKPGYECRHNSRYWKRQDYLGLGLGASSCLQEVRFKNTPVMQEYLCCGRGFPKEEIQYLTIEEQMEETMFLGLRRMDGVDREQFYDQFRKRPEEVFGDAIAMLEHEKLLQYSGNHIRLTERGIDISNYVLAQFLLD